MNMNYRSSIIPNDSRILEEPMYVDAFPSVNNISNGSVFIVKNYESRYLTHKFHKYPGKFIPELPRWAIANFAPSTPGAWVLDPFVGSGTTLVEASLRGINAIGLDVDPLARLIAKVKSTALDPELLQDATRELLERVDGTRIAGYRPSIPTLNHWFSDDAVERLSQIRGAVDSFEASPDLHDFFTVCFSSIIRRASNADNQTMKTYVSHTLPKKPEDANRLFRSTLDDYVARMVDYWGQREPSSKTEVLGNIDARTLASGWIEKDLPTIDLAVTSPPYIKSVDYVYNQMAELFWIGDRWGLATQKDQNEAKRKYMGNDRPLGRSVEAPAPPPIGDIPYWVDRVTSADRKLGHVASRYFNDSVAHFRNIARVLKLGGTYVYVVGDSTIAGVAIPTHKLVAQCAAEAGFELTRYFGYEIRNKHMRFPRSGRGGHVVHDWVMVFRNEGV